MTHDRATHRPFVPALGSAWLTPCYDVVARLFGEQTIKRELVRQARIVDGADVLDLGCGTGTLALLVKALHPGARMTGLDVDPDVLAIARGKVAAAGAAVRLVEGSATAPPFPPASFDRVLTTLVLHHLTTPEKRDAFAAVRRLLRPGGELHVADWGTPRNALMWLASLSFRWFDGAETTAANLRGELPALIAAAGFADVRETLHRSTPFGTLTYLSARVP